MTHKLFLLILFVGILLGGCSPAAQSTYDAASGRPAILIADAQAYALFPAALGARTASLLATDDSGLTGRNREWGALFSPRFQLGAGSALRTTLVAGRPDAAARAFRAIEVGAAVIQADGYVPSRVPPAVSGGAEPTKADVAGGAAFFLGDACLGLLALEANARPGLVAVPERREVVRGRLVAALGWLLAQEELLMWADQAAPNRLLFDARAFQACGALASDNRLRAEASGAASRFVYAGLALLSPAGYFVEAGGFDTSYQGVAVAVGEDILLAGYTGGALPASLTRAAEWLVERVGPKGQIESADNRRTCGGGETFLGEPKRIDVSNVFTGLVYAGIRTRHQPFLSAASRIEEWVKANPGADPCLL